MSCKNASFLTIVIASAVVILLFAQANRKNESQLLTQIARNEVQIRELEKKIKTLDNRLGNVEVGLGEAQSQLEWKVQPLASESK
ncbi:hypothetical protein [Microbulbifer pacificus]|uniref:Cell division protein FtsL n=1 Tax=Microbulbifer pacificus TaxID=407164 RepID=A0AAU0MXX4_9GAMM|nr:hypothetical protein [Microbulbifer pacificus]WOX05056.1 hypothetical protein R5R33_15105 [Microbulbifer pacificus]